MDIDNYIKLCDELFKYKSSHKEFQSFSFSKKLDNGLFRYRCNKNRNTFDSQYHLTDRRIHIYNHNFFLNKTRTVFIVSYSNQIVGNVRLFNEEGPRSYYINKRGNIGYIRNSEIMVKSNSQIRVNLEILDSL